MSLLQLSCFAHTLDLAVTDSIKANSDVELALKSYRQLVPLFHTSCTAKNRLETQCVALANLDSTFGGAIKLKPHVPTRWNSSLIMLCSLLKL